MLSEGKFLGKTPNFSSPFEKFYHLFDSEMLCCKYEKKLCFNNVSFVLINL